MGLTLDFDKTQQLLGNITIPAAPVAFMKLHEILQQDHPAIEQIAATIARDPGLAALVLKTVNSPFFGLRQKVTTLQHATTLLGLVNISNIVAGLALRRAMEASEGPSPQGFWDSPANIGQVAARLARRFGGISADQAYLLGLFHDAGQVLMIRRFPDYATAIEQAAQQRMSLVEVEEARYQTTHATLGYLISRSWSISPEISQLILRHHDVNTLLEQGQASPTPDLGLLAVLKIAEYVDLRYWGQNNQAEWELHKAAVLGYLNLDEYELEDLVEEMVELLMNQDDG